MTTLEPVWKPAALERRAVRRGQPGRPRLRARAPRAGRAGIGAPQRSGLRRAGVAPGNRLRRCGVRRSPSSRRGRHLDGAGAVRRRGSCVSDAGAGAATADLMRAAGRPAAAELAAERPALESLARTGARDTVREGAFVALLRVHRIGSAQSALGADRRVAAAARSISCAPRPRRRRSAPTSLAAPCWRGSRDGVAAGTPLRRRAARHGPLRPARASGPRDRSLSLTEVQVFSGGENVALKGNATQSSVLAGGGTGGHALRAIDGGLEPNLPAGTDPLKGTVAFTSAEQDPVVGGRSRRRAADRHDRAVGRGGDTRTGLHVSVLDGRASRSSSTTACGSTARRSRRGRRRFHVPLQNAAIACLPAAGARAETLPAARGASWPAGARVSRRWRRCAAARRRLAGSAACRPSRRCSATCRDADGAAVGPPSRDDGLRARVRRAPAGRRAQAMTAQLDALVVRIIRIEAVARR